MSSRIVVIQVIWDILVIWVIFADNESVDQGNFGHSGNFGNFDRLRMI